MSTELTAGDMGVSVDQEISSTISHGLHQATQPLTVLQGTLELALLTANTVEDYKQAVERSLDELRRVTDCFDHLRTVAQLHQRVSDVTTFSVLALVREVLMTLKGRSSAAGVDFVLQSKLGQSKLPGDDRVTISRSRILTALKMSVLELVPLMPSRSKAVVLIEGDATEVLIRVDGATGQAVIASSDSPVITQRHELAQAMAASAGAVLTFTPTLRGIVIRLPKVPATKTGAEIRSVKDEVAHV